MISLFVQIYKDKDLCSSLIAKFKEMNNSSKGDEKNMDRNKDLWKYIESINDISSEADNLIKSNDYDPIQFYAIILLWVQQSDPIASVIDAEELFNASASIPDAIFWKAKIYKTFVDFCFPKILNYFSFVFIFIINNEK